ncbi:uncharacterized protein LOC107632892 [Arachis ipaensis]|uniref:uncharacterized protein LOC107632892 n=1 Tax=Arachis ipaensis TaxID=130454 RepID=UPI0007AF964D|nr:uncharacterized protein LOC107632892 [Arachis ipaensis]
MPYGHIERLSKPPLACHLTSLFMENLVTCPLNWNIKHIGTKFLNFHAKAVGEKRLLQLNELDEFKVEAYENAKLYKEKTKRWHDKRISVRTFEHGQRVVLFNSRLKLFPRKLKSRWSGPLTITTVSSYGHLEIMEENSERTFTVNRQRLKHYFGGEIDHQRIVHCLT